MGVLILTFSKGALKYSIFTNACDTLCLQMGEDAFWAEFGQLIKFPMVVYNREPTVERTIDFIAKFVTSLSSKQATEVNQREESEADCNPLLQRLFDFLLQVGLTQTRLKHCSVIHRVVCDTVMGIHYIYSAMSRVLW